MAEIIIVEISGLDASANSPNLEMNVMRISGMFEYSAKSNMLLSFSESIGWNDVGGLCFFLVAATSTHIY